MWFFGWAVEDHNPTGDGGHLGDAIYHARSKDLRHWEVYAGKDGKGEPVWDSSMTPERWTPVVKAGTAVFDNAANGDPSVVRRGDTYYMAFSSVGFETHAETTPQHLYLINCVAGARSPDGITWHKTEAPIVIWQEEFKNRWDIAPDGKQPAPKDYYGSYHRPSLLFDEGRWRMWFDYYLPGTFVSMGYAENAGDFMNPRDWKVLRAGASPLLKDWPNTAVIKVKDHYVAFSDAPNYPAELGGDGRQITIADSTDGLNWTVQGHVRPEGMASSHIPEALLRQEKDGLWLYLFYAWKPARDQDAPWDFRYKEIRFIRRQIDSSPTP